MDFKFPRNTKTIKEIYDSFKDEQLVIDDSYQRRKVWLDPDKVRLIETILLNLIIPEIFLWDYEIDPDTGNTVRHIVDGQQRINAIVDFILGEYKLTSKYLLDESITEKFGDLYFKDLPSDVKKDIWGYDISIVNIDKKCKKDDIKNMFYRLNLTDYSLNEQEKRNSLSSEFGNVSEILSGQEFWENHKIFSKTDVRRMRDIEFCSNILILAREGIIDQASQKKINQVYDELKEDYPDKEEDIARVKKAMLIIDTLTNDDTFGFISKKAQLYSIFSFAFDIIDNEIKLEDSISEKFTAFIKTYNSFKNEKEFTFDDPELTSLYEGIKRYKLASSEGINKMANRMIRFEVLKKICINDDDDIPKRLLYINEKLRS